ncbi:hypothetical protein [Actinopolymorpha alba]|nr:hypothetical protein [Actinopolymorpha alba]
MSPEAEDLLRELAPQVLGTGLRAQANPEAQSNKAAPHGQEELGNPQ